MRNRRDFVKTLAAATAGGFVAQRGFAWAQGGAAPKRREVSIGRKLIKVIDSHHHLNIADVARVVKGTPFEQLSDQMVGPLMYGIASDPVAGAKVIAEFAKENELFVIKAGAMANTKMSDKDVKALALLPSRLELLAKLMGTMQAPVAKLARTLNEVPGKFVRTLAAVRDSRQAA